MAFPEEDGPDVLLFEVQGQAENPAGELQELVVHDPVEAVEPGDPVADGRDGPDLPDIDARLVSFDMLLDDLRDLIGFDAHGNL